MITQFAAGALLIGLTVTFQAFAFDTLIKRTWWPKYTSKGLLKALTVAIMVLAVSCVLIAEIWLWGIFYLFIDVVPDLETALYFSTVSFTTVGYGDVVLGADWRMLGAIESLNGFLLFGWSTAFIFEVVSRIYRKEGETLKY